MDCLQPPSSAFVIALLSYSPSGSPWQAPPGHRLLARMSLCPHFPSLGNSWTLKVMTLCLSYWHMLLQRSTIKTAVQKMKFESNIKVGNIKEQVNCDILVSREQTGLLWGELREQVHTALMYLTI